jgi:ribose transport system permease protein
MRDDEPDRGCQVRRTSALLNLPRGQSFWVTLSVLIIGAGMCVVSPDAFATYDNIYNITRNFAFIAIIALGQTAVIITAGVDLSVGSVMGVAGIVTGLVMTAGYSFWLGAGAGILVSLACGLVNGVLIAYLELSSFVVTLGMLSIARSVALIVSNNKMVYQFGPDERILFWLGGGDIWGVPNVVSHAYLSAHHGLSLPLHELGPLRVRYRWQRAGGASDRGPGAAH